ncbi:hypothetical protein NDU88_004214 [Pleurodeles waltl]|uniref:Uncharacterized protein n=1 Tax=Pleurodeles waltl TaxID=8319 RepID=A0AAV7SI53_PLEWA|nr:hypothetical protein NDU88_004214 [Pleurodeles waltl]
MFCLRSQGRQKWPRDPARIGRDRVGCTARYSFSGLLSRRRAALRPRPWCLPERVFTGVRPQSTVQRVSFGPPQPWCYRWGPPEPTTAQCPHSAQPRTRDGPPGCPRLRDLSHRSPQGAIRGPKEAGGLLKRLGSVRH